MAARYVSCSLLRAMRKVVCACGVERESGPKYSHEGGNASTVGQRRSVEALLHIPCVPHVPADLQEDASICVEDYPPEACHSSDNLGMMLTDVFGVLFTTDPEDGVDEEADDDAVQKYARAC